jgi:hypothetical protein
MSTLTFRKSFCASTVAWLLLAAVAAAEESKWLGVLTPEERQAARREVAASYSDLGLGSLPLTGPAKDDYPDIQGPKIYERLLNIVEFSEQSRRDGAILWGRVAGTKYQHETAQYIQKKFGEFGLRNIHADSMPRNAQWWPTTSRVTVVLEDSRGNRSTYVLRSAFPAPPSPSAPAGGLEAELVDVGMGRPVDLLGRDVRDKIAVLRSFPELGSVATIYSGRGVPAKLAKMGAVGVITIVQAPGNAQTFLYESYADPAPAFVLGADDGDFLEELIGRAAPPAKLRLRMELTTEKKQGWTMENVYGMIPGSIDEYVIVMAHQDGWFDAAIDNASGLATMLTLAEHYARESGTRRPRRNILFLATGGHHLSLTGYQKELGIPSPGVQDLLDRYPEIVGKTALVLNCEHTASIATQTADDTRTHLPIEQQANTENIRVLAITNQSPRVLQYARDAIDRYGLVVAKNTRHVAYGDPSLLQDVLPVFNFIETLGWYHSTADTPALISRQGLERTARAFAFVLDKVDATSRADLERGARPLKSSSRP